MFNFNRRLKGIQQEIHSLGAGSGYCECRSSGIREKLYKLLMGPDAPEYVPEKCQSEVHNPRPEVYLKRSPAETKRTQESIREKLFGDMSKLEEKPPEIPAAVVDPETERPLFPAPEKPQEEPDPLRDAIAAKYLNRAQLAEKLLVPPDKIPEAPRDLSVARAVESQAIDPADPESNERKPERAIHVSVLARHMIEKNGLDPTLIQGSGKNGLICLRDVKKVCQIPI